MAFEIGSVGVIAAFAAGMISFLSPCVLPLVPGYVSYIAGNAPTKSGRAAVIYTLLLSLCFVLGFSSIFIALGAGAGALSRLLLIYRYEANIFGGVIVIIFGIFSTGLIKFPFLNRDIRYHGAIDGGRPIGALLLGMAFGFGWTPCIGPVLGAILTVSATSADPSTGIALLTIYSAGLGVPFVFSAVFADKFTGRLRRARRAGMVLNLVAGVVMITMGVAMITGYLSTFAFWLLEMVPALSRIG